MHSYHIDGGLLIMADDLPINIFYKDGICRVGCMHYSPAWWNSCNETDIKALAFMYDYSKDRAVSLWHKYRNRVLALCA